VAEELGDRYRTATLLVARGRLATDAGELADAVAFYRRALPDGEAVPRTTVAEWLEGLAVVAAGAPHRVLSGEDVAQHRVCPDRTARLLGAAAGLRATIGAPVLPRHAAVLECARDTALGALGPDRFAAAWSEGQRLGLREAVRCGQAGFEADELDGASAP
jgi:hypothetical protein